MTNKADLLIGNIPDSKVRKYIDLFFKAEPKKPFYHYTKYDALSEILRSQVLWFTHFQHLNDPSECAYAHKLFSKSIKNHAKYSSNKSFWDSFLEKYSMLLDKGCLINDHKIEHPIYTVSFCSSRDYLPAWRFYGDNGKGVAIGFHPKFYSYSVQGTVLNNPIANFKVIYNKKKISEFVSGVIKIIDEEISMGRIKHGEFTYLASILIPYSAGFKHYGYASEKELRYTITEQKIDGKYEIKGVTLPHIPSERKFLRNDKPMSESEKFNKDHIAEIWIGPGCTNFEKRKKEIKDLLSKYEYDLNTIKIIQSKMPYRPN